MQILVSSLVLLNLVKNVSYFLFIALCTERFEPPHSLSTSKKKLQIQIQIHITNINIWSYNLKCSEKTALYFHFTARCYVHGTQKKLKIASFIEHAERFRMHITIIIIPYYALRFGKEKCFIIPFLLCLYCIALCTGYDSNKSLNHLQRTRLRQN